MLVKGKYGIKCYENTVVGDTFDGACRQYLKEAWHELSTALSGLG